MTAHHAIWWPPTALHSVAAYGGVIEGPDGSRREVQGQTPRTALQEVTAALAVLQHLPADAEAVLQVDAQLDELQSVLVITYPRPDSKAGWRMDMT